MEYKPLEGRVFPRFSGVKTFFRLPIANVNEKFDVALFGVPFDGGSTYRTGQRFAPQGVRSVSSLGRGYHWERDVSLFQKLKIADVGDSPTVPIDLNQTYSLLEKFTTDIVETGKKFMAVGGDHSITLPILRALRKKLGKPLGLIHFDAHFDTFPPAWGCDYHHGTFVRHAVNESLIDPELTVQIGIRGPLAAKSDGDFSEKNKIKVWSMDDIRSQGVQKLSQHWPKFGKTPVYVSFDVDCLDPAYAPGTGTPVIGGMTSYEAQLFMRSLPKANFVGADVVEVLPAYDNSEVTQLTAVDVMFEMLCHMAKNHG